jgi:hypothetical protein
MAYLPHAPSSGQGIGGFDPNPWLTNMFYYGGDNFSPPGHGQYKLSFSYNIPLHCGGADPGQPAYTDNINLPFTY